jgi:hypothetical protein
LPRLINGVKGIDLLDVQSPVFQSSTIYRFLFERSYCSWFVASSVCCKKIQNEWRSGKTRKRFDTYDEKKRFAVIFPSDKRVLKLKI